ncbi:predicted protein [Naegleria gruberi]|uniref:Predicted protein n=1 Tax=Naegleria gruberi TaxID=5762 RepID=D2VT62_NAEGR|nr:uncharacterized protein NAEGRDRAFT_52051 [Naegleria gruberi]EFC40091.1 predicted protein [Naegleria gruberi]|eukprot:XP_002672835.1 predicted protein [Naegleria gruberi strain NEG-M]
MQPHHQEESLTRLVFLDPLEKHYTQSLLRNKFTTEKTVLCLGDYSMNLLKTFHLTPVPSNFLITDIKFYQRRKLLLVGHSMGIDGYDLESGEQSFHLESENAVIRMCLVEGNQEEETDVIFATMHHEFGYNVLKFILSQEEIEIVESDLGLLNAKCELTYRKDKKELYVLDVSDGKISVLDGLSMQLKYEIENEFTKRAVCLSLNEYTNELIILTGNNVRIYDYIHNHADDGLNTLVKLYGDEYSICQEMMMIDSVDDLSGMIFDMQTPYFNFLIGKKGMLHIIDGSSPSISKSILGYLNPPQPFNSYYFDKHCKKLFSFDQKHVYQLELKLELNTVEMPLSEEVCNLVEKLEGQLPNIYTQHNSTPIPPSLCYFNSIFWKKPIWFRISDMEKFDSEIEKDTTIAPIRIRKWKQTGIGRSFQFQYSNSSKIWDCNKNIIPDASIIGGGEGKDSIIAIVVRSTEASSKDFPLFIRIDRTLYRCNISKFLSHLEKSIIIVMQYNREVFLKFDFEKMYSNLTAHYLINENSLELDKIELSKAYSSLIHDDLLNLVSKHLSYEISFKGKVYSMLDLYVLAKYYNMHETKQIR